MIKRRDFLKISGVVLATTGLAHPTIKSLAAESVTARGRVLTKTPLRDSPGDDGQSIKVLMPDSVQAILGYQDGWIQVSDGYVAEQYIQPMLDANHQPVEKLPAWAEVIAPYAAVRQWMQTEAPLMTRLGHGAVLQVDARLDDASGREWLRVDLNADLPGWVQAEHMQPVQVKKTRVGLTATLDRAENVLLLEHRGREAARFAIARPERLSPGEYRIETRRPGRHFPWELVTDGGFSLHGTTTHNHFARIADGENVELSVIAAKTIYAALPDGAKLTIR